MNKFEHQIFDYEILDFANKIGLNHKANLKYLHATFFKGMTFLPDMAMHFGSFFTTKDIIRSTGTTDIPDGIGFVFHNVFEDKSARKSDINKEGAVLDSSYVRIFPYDISQKIAFRKNTKVTHVAISVSAQYLKDFLQEELEHFSFLFDRANNFLIEELMTDNILRTISDIVNIDEPKSMRSFYYKTKAMELLLHLFESLGRRQNSGLMKLNQRDIEAIYKVRDKIRSSLSKATSTIELVKIAGMNELKLRKIFAQVFGMGIYEYYQHLRMREAGRLLREEQLSVSEAGYQMGFENLGHFTRVFEKHIGIKPFKYFKSFKI